MFSLFVGIWRLHSRLDKLSAVSKPRSEENEMRRRSHGSKLKPNRMSSHSFNVSRGVLNSSARDTLDAPLFRTRSRLARLTPRHQHVPHHNPGQPSPQEQPRGRPRQGARGGFRRARARRLPRLSCRAFPPGFRVGRARATDRARRRDRRDAHARDVSHREPPVGYAHRVAPPWDVPPHTRGDRGACFKNKHPVVARLL